MRADPQQIPGDPEKATQPSSNATGDRVLLELNDRWQLAHDGRLQWILQVRHSRSGRPAKWSGRRFHVERNALLRSIAELCGAVDLRAVETIRAWPARYSPQGG